MLRGAQGEWFAVAGAIEPDEAAQCVVDGMHKEQFLILTHPLVEKYFAARVPTTTTGSPRCEDCTPKPATEIMSTYERRHVYIDGGWRPSAGGVIEVDSPSTVRLSARSRTARSTR